MNKPFSPSADKNKQPILNELRNEVKPGQSVLEIGAGTGQHACYFSAELPEIIWQPTELKANLPTIKSRIAEQNLTNLHDPIELNVNHHPWPKLSAQVCYTCNTFHIVSMESVQSMLVGCKTVLGETGKLCVYGPFSIQGKHTSPSNEHFNEQLQRSDSSSGVRDLTELDILAQQSGFSACRYVTMPANNFFVVWEI